MCTGFSFANLQMICVCVSVELRSCPAGEVIDVVRTMSTEQARSGEGP